MSEYIFINSVTICLCIKLFQDCFERYLPIEGFLPQCFLRLFPRRGTYTVQYPKLLQHSDQPSRSVKRTFLNTLRLVIWRQAFQNKHNIWNIRYYFFKYWVLLRPTFLLLISKLLHLYIPTGIVNFLLVKQAQTFSQYSYWLL